MDSFSGGAAIDHSRHLAASLSGAVLRLLAHAFPACGPVGLGVEDMAGGLALVGSYRMPGDKAESRLMVRIDEALPLALGLVLACRHFEVHLAHVARLRPEAASPVPGPVAADADNILYFPQQVPPREVPLAVDMAWRQLALALEGELDRLAALATEAGFACDVLDRLWLCPNCGRDEAGLVVTLGQSAARAPEIVPA